MIFQASVLRSSNVTHRRLRPGGGVVEPIDPEDAEELTAAITLFQLSIIAMRPCRTRAL